MSRSEKNLRSTLKANAVFSFSSGLILALAHQTIAHWMNITSPYVLLFIGIGLMLFACYLVLNAFRKVLNRKEVHSIVLQDWAWVLGSALILLFQPFGLSQGALLAIAGVALVVMAFALLQMRNLRGMTS